MVRLQVRVYRPVGQTDRWAMLGGTESREQIQQWLKEYSRKGLIFHTGFSVLPREVLVDLLPHCRDGVVVCAATKAVFPELFDAKNIEVCRGMDDDGSAPIGKLDSWFFKLANGNETFEDYADLRLVNTKSQTLSPQPVLRSLPDASDLSQEFSDALKSSPELSDALLSAGINKIELFRDHWSSLPMTVAYQVASALMDYGQETYKKRLNSGLIEYRIKECGAIVHLVRYLPPWDSGVPKSPVRLYNALLGKGVNTLYKLEHERPIEILKIPNLGKQSMLSLYQYLIDYEVPYPIQSSTLTESGPNIDDSAHLENQSGAETALEWSDYELHEAPTFASLLNSVIDELQANSKKDRQKQSFEYLKRRFSGETLEAIAEGQGITRERVRQITDKMLKHLTSHLEKGSTEPARNLKRVLILAKSLFSKEGCSHVEFSNFVRIFSQTDKLDLSAAQRRMLEKIYPDLDIQFIPFNLASNVVVLPVTAKQPVNLDESLESVMKSLLERIHGMNTRDAEAFAKRQFLSVLDSDFIASVLAVEAILYRSSIDDNDIVRMVDERLGTGRAIEEIVGLLRKAGRPMHGVDEIYPNMPKLYRDSVNERRVAGHINEHQERCPSTSSDFIFTMGRGRYALWEHFNIDDEQGQLCAKFIEKFLNENQNRQFTDNDLYTVLDSNGYVTWQADHVDRHRIVSAILMRYRPSKVRYLGRFVWTAGVWSDQFDTASRYQIHELIEEYIKEKGQPVSKRELDDYIGSIRGRGNNLQYHEQHGLVRLTGSGKNALYWHESLDPMPFDSIEVQALREEIADLIANSTSSGIFMPGLKADIVRNSDIVSQYSSAQFLALLLRMRGIRVKRRAPNRLVVTMERGTADA